MVKPNEHLYQPSNSKLTVCLFPKAKIVENLRESPEKNTILSENDRHKLANRYQYSSRYNSFFNTFDITVTF